MLTRPVIVLFSFSCGLAVATIYFSQPLLDTIGAQFSMPTAQVGIVLTLTQIGYAIGLLLIVPLGDIVDQRRLIVGQTVLLGVALLATAISPNAWTFLLSITTLGALAVVTQVMVTYTRRSTPHGNDKGGQSGSSPAASSVEYSWRAPYPEHYLICWAGGRSMRWRQSP
ncbi:major facilitator transporter [Mycobacteroides abscessus subsp. abscessus]|nr:major facilitator transporter [Mycobacteroides abscessus subsp. abscessus]SHX32108.1 major facilitator transporter [Mycobacteroides abscessus subsp. abscessus]SIH46355.1 major facilitator transporter [Mycobacteroides abscessus subsp. abscessus]SKD15844.1 major facilitator transporter [Mycobacteroides abscessus subsp. abscessus]SKM72267.1 major facilitator transporter [Mycobacteroides abscessus subsp. abscessus]